MRRFPRAASTAGLLGALVACGCGIPGLSKPRPLLEEVKVSITVPNPCWRVRIQETYRRNDAVLVVSELVPPPEDVMCAQVIAVARDRVWLRLAPPRPDVRHLVVDPRGGGRLEKDPAYVFLRSLEELDEALAGAEPMRGQEP